MTPSRRPTLRDDAGHAHEVSQAEALNGAAATAGILLGMVAWDLGAHAWWTLGNGAVLLLPWRFRVAVRLVGVVVMWLVLREAWRAQRAEDDATTQDTSGATG